jgi:anaerobic glycerol-3-phosphate dehydrogenase C subunit
MDPQRSRIQQDLRGLIAGDVLCDDLTLQLYASDASVYQIKPLGVVLPRSTADVAACLQYCNEHGLAVHARGAGTGLAGESLGPGLVLDFSRHLRRILHTDEQTVRVQPGVVLERLNAHLRRLGRHFGPDPATSSVTTLGSVVALDASGSHWLRYGSARQHVKSLQMVLADGEVLEVARETVPHRSPDEATQRREQLVLRLAALLRREAELIARCQPRSLVNRSGYHLPGVLQGDALDLPRLLVGSEGTLALFTEITLATHPLPRYRAVALLFFDALEKAARAALEIAASGASACDLIDRRHLTLARELKSQYVPILPMEAEALLLVEYCGEQAAEVRDAIQGVVEHMRRKKKLAFDSRVALDDDEIALFWELATRVVPTLYRLKGHTRPLPFVEDMAVPPEALPAFLVTVQNILKRQQVTASLFAHAGHGQLHLRPFLDLADRDDIARLYALARELYEAVWDVGGTISGEHGDGLSRTEFVRRQYGELYRVFQEIKRLFDPHNILNPGKKIAGPRDLTLEHLRPVVLRGAAAAPTSAGTGPPPAPSPLVTLELNWNETEMAHMARTCNGCGACRTQAVGEVRMCPIFRFAPREEASPRAKANMMRAILTGELEPSALETDELKAVADLCVNCHMCRLECPASVDIPRLMIEAKAAYVRANGLRFTDWVVARIDRWGAIGSRFATLANWALRSRTMRWLLEKTLGIAQGRKLPRFARRTFLRQAARRRLTRPTRRTGRKVLYFVDHYVNYHDPQLGDALVAVMEHNGVAVYVPPQQRYAGMPLLALGGVAEAKRLAAHNVELLAEAVRQGYHIVATEPTAVLCLTREYPALLGDDDSRLVADNTSEACDYLWRQHTTGNLQLDFQPLHAALAYHTPCHLKALQIGTPGLQLLRLIPSVNVQRVEEGCSGMAGTWGLKREHYRSSLRAGWGLISHLRQSQVQAGTTECSACKIQMEQGTTKPTIHPIKLLAFAYGLMPEVASLLTKPGEELIVT